MINILMSLENPTDIWKEIWKNPEAAVVNNSKFVQEFLRHLRDFLTRFC